MHFGRPKRKFVFVAVLRDKKFAVTRERRVTCPQVSVEEAAAKPTGVKLKYRKFQIALIMTGTCLKTK
jgi:hypothetical protein